ncbi:DUF1801 domain-containing protein [Actinokineospora auranticolor]|uniref:Uncharacterized protein DUF1801 n=1 Tax=Actinokineospora auranticolor TaxID=155976 RepID=A0A2S6GWS7_9PSEU|nr:DUF1801 domain-containing protein [Actinokineospora auranticolor]PPK69674.1 uncharacterized protein DUF1801 [Actinokineospora auranticolor]
MPKPTVAEYVANVPTTLRPLTESLVGAIDATFPTPAAMWHGHPVWSLGETPGKTPVCFVKAYTKHVTLGFWKGQSLTDPTELLAGSGSQQMASMKLDETTVLDPPQLRSWVEEARSLETP